MFWQNFSTTFSATFEVFILAACGYFAVRFKWIDDSGLKQITGVLVNLLLPCFTFIQLSRHFEFGSYAVWWQLPLLYIVMAVAALAIGWVTARLGRVPKNLEKQFLALVGFQNCGNIPLVVVATLFSGTAEHALFVYISLFIVGANLMIWTLGVLLVVGGGKVKLDAQKIFNPPVLTTIGTLVLVALGAQKYFPETVVRPVEMLGNCALPLAMFTVGGNLADIKFARIDPRPASLLVLAKMVLFPLLALWVVLAYKVDFLFGFLIVLEAAVPSAVTLSLIAKHYDIDDEMVNEGVLITHVLSLITVPIFLTLYLKFAGAPYGF